MPNSDNKYALIIGVGEDLPVTVRDAEAIYNKLTDPILGDYPEENVFLLTDKKADKTGIVEHLKKLVSLAHEDPDATVIIYYSGHGGQVERKDKTTAYYLMTYGYDDYDVEGTMLEGNIFSYLVNNIQCRKVLVLLDCCNADGMEDEDSVFTAQTQVPGAVDRSGAKLLKGLKGGRGRVFVSSSKDDQKSLILEDADNSLFTQVVLDTLDGKYTDNEDEHIPVIDLVASVLKKVPKEANKIGREQHPVLSNADDLDAHFQICPNRRKGRSRSFNEKLREIQEYENQIDKQQVHNDFTQIIEEHVPEELIKEVEKLIDDNKNIVQRIFGLFSRK